MSKWLSLTLAVLCGAMLVVGYTEWKEGEPVFAVIAWTLAFLFIMAGHKLIEDLW